MIEQEGHGTWGQPDDKRWFNTRVAELAPALAAAAP